MAKRVAFCLVENDSGQVLLIQRGYGKEKFKWSLPGGNCDGQEDYHRAASREVREETGLRVEIISTVFEGQSHAIKTYFGKIRGGHLKARRPECLDAKFFDYNHLPPLAFSADHRAVQDWQKMKSTHARLASNPRTPPCPSCGSDNTRLRHDPHHNPYRCQTCNKVFAADLSVLNPSNEARNMVNEKDNAIQNTVLNYILSERERLRLLAPMPSTALSTAARDTAIWLASEEDPEDKIYDYLSQRCAEQPDNANSIRFLQLAYCRHFGPTDAGPSEIAKDLIEKTGLSEIAQLPALDYLGMSSCFAVVDQSGSPVEITGGEPDSFGYVLVVAYATDGNSMIVDRINERRVKVGVVPLQIAIPLRETARKFITMSTDDITRDSLSHEAQIHGYAAEGWRIRLDYGGCFAEVPSGGETSVVEPEMADIVATQTSVVEPEMADIVATQTSVVEPEMADIVATQLVKGWPTLLRPDWQDIGIATGAKNHPELGGLNFQAEFVIGWRIPFDTERPAHFQPPMDQDGTPATSDDAGAHRSSSNEATDLLGHGYHSRRRRSVKKWYPFLTFIGGVALYLGSRWLLQAMP